MRILIFDDDKSSVDMLLQTVNWVSLGITEFIPVYNVAQAKEAFIRGEQIDLMLCDIEAPGENGIDLLRWVRQQGYPVENIFLTNYAEFKFAYEAMRLDSVEYILKMSPVPVIEDAVRRGIGRIQKRMQLDDYAAIKQQRCEEELQKVWLEYLTGDGGRKAAERLVELSNRKIGINSRYILVLCSFNGKINAPNGNVEQYLVNTAKEIVSNEGQNSYAIYGRQDRNHLWLVLPQKMEDCCKTILCRLEKYYVKILPDIVTNIYHAKSNSLMELPRIRHALERMEADNVIHIGSVLEWHETSRLRHEVQTPQLPKDLWMKELREDRGAELFEQIRLFIADIKKNGQINRSVLQEFHTDYMQMLYAVLEQERVQGHKLFQDETARQLHDAADRSVFDMIKWVGFSVKRTCEAIQEVQGIKTSIDMVREYIDEHYCERLQRNDIARQFYMSEDHLSHAFNS